MAKEFWQFVMQMVIMAIVALIVVIAFKSVRDGHSKRCWKKTVHASIANTATVKTGYTVTVNYSKTLEEMIVDGHYDWSSPNINGKNFLVKGEGIIETMLVLVHLDKEVSMAKVEAYLEVEKLRPATLEELLAFGAKYPDVQREFPIMEIDSSWVDRNLDRSIPNLTMHGSERVLSLYWYDGLWFESCRFLAVRK